MHRQANRRLDPALIVKGATRAVMLARNCFVPDPPELGERTGAVAKYARGTDYHQALRERPGLTGMRRNAQIALDNSDKGVQCPTQ